MPYECLLIFECIERFSGQLLISAVPPGNGIRIRHCTPTVIGSKKRPVVEGSEPVPKKRRTTKGKASASTANMNMASVAQGAVPLQVIEPTPVVTAAQPPAPKRKSRKRKLILSEGSDDDNIEENIDGESVKVSGVNIEEPIEKVSHVSDEVDVIIGQILIETSKLTTDDTESAEQIFTETDVGDIVFGDSTADNPEELAQWLENYISEGAEQVNESDSDRVQRTVDTVDDEQLFETANVEEAEGSKHPVVEKDLAQAVGSKQVAEELMSIDDLLLQIPDDMLLPSVTEAEITKIRLGESISINEVQERDLYYASLPRISALDKGKEILEEHEPVKGNPTRETVELICGDVGFLVQLRDKVAAIRNEQLELQTKIAADILSLSTQLGDIVEYIRGGDAKKGKEAAAAALYLLMFIKSEGTGDAISLLDQLLKTDLKIVLAKISTNRHRYCIGKVTDLKIVLAKISTNRHRYCIGKVFCQQISKQCKRCLLTPDNATVFVIGTVRVTFAIKRFGNNKSNGTSFAVNIYDDISYSRVTDMMTTFENISKCCKPAAASAWKFVEFLGVHTTECAPTNCSTVVRSVVVFSSSQHFVQQLVHLHTPLILSILSVDCVPTAECAPTNCSTAVRLAVVFSSSQHFAQQLVHLHTLLNTSSSNRYADVTVAHLASSTATSTTVLHVHFEAGFSSDLFGVSSTHSSNRNADVRVTDSSSSLLLNNLDLGTKKTISSSYICPAVGSLYKQSADGLVFMESAVELAMETSKVESAVRNQAEAKLNQLEHDEPAETMTTSC
ncbi:hypothetical protein F511_05680 [Dorcoceras hygrometricum]|uniref:Uncharacterized protein n=1 Tax=Dorcoceras hygrometricum TaxID=472368 RepID=A0A2Z7BZZ1_9LAMI|nr:hypothetical protein F511_05680 [Dorcoceras hygrometricum]